MPPSRYSMLGFVPATSIAGIGLVYLDQANVSIEKGDAVHDDGSGYATNTGTAFAATFRGIAAAASDNSGGSDGDVKVAIIPADADVKYWVNDTGQLLAQAQVGAIVDLQANDSIDSSDVTLVEWGFIIDEIDISAAAIAANAFGFALGRLQKTPQ